MLLIGVGPPFSKHANAQTRAGALNPCRSESVEPADVQARQHRVLAGYPGRRVVDA